MPEDNSESLQLAARLGLEVVKAEDLVEAMPHVLTSLPRKSRRASAARAEEEDGDSEASDQE